MWVRVATLLLVLQPSVGWAEPALKFTGHVVARHVNATGRDSWLAGDWGRLESGAHHNDLFAEARAGVDWTPSRFLDVHVSGVARQEPARFAGDAIGLVEAFVRLRLDAAGGQVQLRAGQFFLPTSRENIDPLWSSPYSLHTSALNSWIGEEVRPIGLDLQWRRDLAGGNTVTAGGTAFRGNDSMGTLLGWRGWAVGSRLTTFGEVLPLPPLEALETFFAEQRDDGTRPFGPDLDGKTGLSVRVRYEVPARAMLQYTWLDNRGDRKLYRGEYAWATRFHLLGAEVGDPDRLVLAAEYMKGSTGMGEGIAFVQTGFHSGYALVSGKSSRNRWTARYEVFAVDERDFTPGGSNEEDGRAWTLSWLFDVSSSVRAGMELTQVTGRREALAEAFLDPQIDGRSIAVELRYRF